MKLTRAESLTKKYIKIFSAVSSYWFCSIGLVFLNKFLLSNDLNAPLFVTWYQCVVTIALCYICSKAATLFPSSFSFPNVKFDYRISREVLPLSFFFVGMITFNNLCLKNVGVSFYYIGRSLTTVFNVICTYLILGQTTSLKAITCCLVIIGGFLLGVNQEDVAGSLSVSGVFFGVMASLFVALNAIFTQRILPSVGDSVVRLTLYNNVNATFLFIPLLLFSGEFAELFYYPNLFSFSFWFLLSLSGVFGFMMGYVTGWQIQVTSPLTHNISGTAKAAAQTVIAVAWWHEIKPLLWWISNVVVLFGSAIYTAVRKQEMVEKHESDLKQRRSGSLENQSLLPTQINMKEDETI